MISTGGELNESDINSRGTYQYNNIHASTVTYACLIIIIANTADFIHRAPATSSFRHNDEIQYTPLFYVRQLHELGNHRYPLSYRS